MKNRKFFLANTFENWIFIYFLRDMIFMNEKKTEMKLAGDKATSTIFSSLKQSELLYLKRFKSEEWTAIMMCILESERQRGNGAR